MEDLTNDVRVVEPMLCDIAPRHLAGDWLAEPKFDGMRIIAERKLGRISLWTRRNKNVASKFPEVVLGLIENMPSSNWVIDGELTVEGGFEALLRRNTDDKLKIRLLSKRTPATLHVFDVLQLMEKFYMDEPLMFRKSQLALIHRNMNPATRLVWGIPWSPERVGDPYELLPDVVFEGYEGVVLKSPTSRYFPGKRSGDWLKVRRSDTVDVEVIGATRSDSALPFGALILAKDGEYYGKVGTGFTDKDRASILAVLKEAATPSSRASESHVRLPDAVQQEVLVLTEPIPAEIKVAEEMQNGSPRHPVWVRWRMEKDV